MVISSRVTLTVGTVTVSNGKVWIVTVGTVTVSNGKVWIVTVGTVTVSTLPLGTPKCATEDVKPKNDVRNVLKDGFHLDQTLNAWEP